MKVLLEKMKYYPDWDKASTSYDYLQILALIEKSILDQKIAIPIFFGLRTRVFHLQF